MWSDASTAPVCKIVWQSKAAAAVGGYWEQDRKLASELHAPQQPAALKPGRMQTAAALAVTRKHAKQLTAPELDRMSSHVYSAFRNE